MDGSQTKARIVSIDLDNDEDVNRLVTAYSRSGHPSVGGAMREALEAIAAKGGEL